MARADQTEHGVVLSPCEAAPLRYVHDVVTGEFINLGVLLSCPDRAFLRFDYDRQFGRVRAMFRDVDWLHLRRTCAKIAEACEQREARAKEPLGLAPLEPISELVAGVVRPDDVGVRFSPIVISGVTPDPERTLDELLRRYVMTDVPARVEVQGRSDHDVWRAFERTIPDPRVSKRLVRHRIASKHVVLEFDHAWKNGMWNVVQPLSLDLVDSTRIVDKAFLWEAKLSDVRPREQGTNVRLLLALPTRDRVDSYDAAMKGIDLLQEKATAHAEIVTEDRREDLVSRMVADMAHHDAVQ